jgi:hypothetical protein
LGGAKGTDLETTKPDISIAEAHKTRIDDDGKYCVVLDF